VSDDEFAAMVDRFAAEMDETPPPPPSAEAQAVAQKLLGK
jgi:hypothetical protein